MDDHVIGLVNDPEALFKGADFAKLLDDCKVPAADKEKVVVASILTAAGHPEAALALVNQMTIKGQMFMYNLSTSIERVLEHILMEGDEGDGS